MTWVPRSTQFRIIGIWIRFLFIISLPFLFVKKRKDKNRKHLPLEDSWIVSPRERNVFPPDWTLKKATHEMRNIARRLISINLKQILCKLNLFSFFSSLSFIVLLHFLLVILFAQHFLVNILPRNSFRLISHPFFLLTLEIFEKKNLLLLQVPAFNRGDDTISMHVFPSMNWCCQRFICFRQMRFLLGKQLK